MMALVLKNFFFFHVNKANERNTDSLYLSQRFERLVFPLVSTGKRIYMYTCVCVCISAKRNVF